MLIIKVTLKNNKTNEQIETFYSVRDLISHGGEDLTIENIIENNVCHCNSVGETNVIECDCWEEWEDCSLIIDEDKIHKQNEFNDRLRWSGDFMYSEILGIPYELTEEEDFAVGHYTLTDFPNINLYINSETGKFMDVWLDEEEEDE